MTSVIRIINLLLILAAPIGWCVCAFISSQCLQPESAPINWNEFFPHLLLWPIMFLLAIIAEPDYAHGFIVTTILMTFLAFPLLEAIKMSIEKDQTFKLNQLQKIKDKENDLILLKEKQEILLNNIKKYSNNLPQLLAESAKALQIAETDFKERAFSPFWENIERATVNLASFRNELKLIDSYSQQYVSNTLILGDRRSPPLIPSLPNPRDIIIKLNKIVRKAQTDFEFSLIYEQIKTNNILVEGFGTLASAIFSMESTISRGFTELASTLESTIDDLTYTLNSNADSISNSLGAIDNKLDNIQ